MYIGGKKESFKCKEIVKKNVITSPEGTWDDEDDDFTTYTHGSHLYQNVRSQKLFIR
jgi:hypothetical protein